MTRTIHVPGVGDLAGHDDQAHRRLSHRFHQQTNVPFDRFDRLVFRGDTRPPSTIFAAGFNKADYGQAITVGILVHGGISTSTDLGTVRQRYGHIGMYIYACLVTGYDLAGVNNLSEILGIRIRGDMVIACAGPVTTPGGYHGEAIVGDIVGNPAYRRMQPDRQSVVLTMGDAFRRDRSAEAPF